MSEKLLKATHQGELKLGENAPALPCAVLEDGTRVISKSAVFKALGRTKRGRIKGEVRVHGMPDLPSFIDANNLQPFISQELSLVLKGVDYEAKNGTVNSGYEATILPLLCDVYLSARKSGVLTKQQLPIAETSEILVRSLSKIGILALVDEATGYQYDREKDELQKILSAYIATELLPWQKRFPDEFYKEIFRLNNWDFTVSGIKKRPGVIGTWTKKLIYNLLPNGVVEELENKTPRSASGNKTARMHQSLTLEIGEPHLEKQLISVITLMNISDTWAEFLKNFGKKFQKDLVAIAQSTNFKASNKTKIKITGQQYLFLEENEVEEEMPTQRSMFDSSLKSLLSVPPPKKEKEG